MTDPAALAIIQEMKKHAVLGAAVACLVLAGSAVATTKPVGSYCSPSGDLCFGVARKNGAVSLDLTTFAQYFTRYTLCVKPPDRASTCRSFPIRNKGRFYKSSVLWHRNYPNRGPGRYRVTWKFQQPLGPTLSFMLS